MWIYHEIIADKLRTGLIWFNYGNISTKHIVHVIRRVNLDRLDNEWITATGDKVSLRAMIVDYLRHFELHLNEISERI